MRSWRKLLAVLATAGVCLGAFGALPAAGRDGKSAAPAIRCRDGRDAAIPFTISVEGEPATGRYALPSKEPKSLVVINHGYSFDSHAWQWIMRDMAREHGVVVVAMDYRGTISPGDFDFDGTPDYHDNDGARWDGSPKARGWAIAAGAADTLAATKLFQDACKNVTETVLFSVSMGAGAGGLALADSEGVFDYWFSVEGVTNLFEEYHGACLAAQALSSDFVRAACEDMGKETGGGNPQELRERTLPLRIDEIAASGVRGVVVVHALEDGSVPYNQARELVAGLVTSRVPTDLFSIGRRDAKSERGTTLTSHAPGNYDSGMAGHASEVSDTHLVMRIAYDRLWALIEKDKTPGPYREFLVDGTTIYPPP